jgi:hypothetical protein
MFKRKQRPTVPTTPPNFLDLRNTAQPVVAAPAGSRVWSDIVTTPVRRHARVWSSRARVSIGVVSLACFGMALYVVIAQQPKNPIQAAVVSKFATTTYYPTYLPKNYALKTNTATVTSGSLTFTASNGSASIFFSEQPLPKGMDLQAFYDSQMPDRAIVHTTYGDAAVGHYANVSQLAQQHLGGSSASTPQSTMASLPTADTWVLITAPDGFATDQMQRIASGLRH